MTKHDGPCVKSLIAVTFWFELILTVAKSGIGDPKQHYGAADYKVSPLAERTRGRGASCNVWPPMKLNSSLLFASSESLSRRVADFDFGKKSSKRRNNESPAAAPRSLFTCGKTQRSMDHLFTFQWSSKEDEMAVNHRKSCLFGTLIVLRRDEA